MSTCDIVSGFTLGCRDNTGGLKNIYILSGSISSTSGTEGLISVISGSGTFYKFELTRQTGDFTETINASLENGTIFDCPFKFYFFGYPHRNFFTVDTDCRRRIVYLYHGKEDGTACKSCSG